jgi:hypothetical protein
VLLGDTDVTSIRRSPPGPNCRGRRSHGWFARRRRGLRLDRAPRAREPRPSPFVRVHDDVLRLFDQFVDDVGIDDSRVPDDDNRVPDDDNRVPDDDVDTVDDDLVHGSADIVLVDGRDDNRS